MLVDAVVSALAGSLSAFIVVLVCSPFAIVFCIGLREEYSFSFWVRAVVLSQLLFWGALIFNAPTYGYNNLDLIKAFFNFVLSVPATALIMRSWMRIRRSKGGEEQDQKDRLDDLYSRAKFLKKWGTKLGGIISK